MLRHGPSTATIVIHAACKSFPEDRGIIRGWVDESQLTFYILRLEASQKADKAGHAPLISSVPRLGMFGSDENDTSSLVSGLLWRRSASDTNDFFYADDARILDFVSAHRSVSGETDKSGLTKPLSTHVVIDDLNVLLAGKMVYFRTRVPWVIAPDDRTLDDWITSNIRSSSAIVLELGTESVIALESQKSASVVELVTSDSIRSSSALSCPTVDVKFQANPGVALPAPQLCRVNHSRSGEHKSNPTDIITHVLATQSLTSSLNHHIRCIYEALTARMQPVNQRSSLLHFLPELHANETIGLVSALFPNMESVADKVEFRTRLHHILGLPQNFPRFLPSMSVKHLSEQDRVSSIHRQVSVPQGYCIYTVRGSYTYYHYGSGFSDAGWGCAYRSLQTIASWLIAQELSSDPVPTHPEIQQRLVDLGDKPASFLHSSQWIGAVEVGLVLQNKYNVEYKLLSIRSGSEVEHLVAQLVSHFSNGGAPVMIGGGVLAYTLLGVAIPSGTMAASSALFLILDPHYIGPDDASVIIRGGWCQWQDCSIFRKDAFYNFCVPLIPERV